MHKSQIAEAEDKAAHFCGAASCSVSSGIETCRVAPLDLHSSLHLFCSNACLGMGWGWEKVQHPMGT